MMFLFTQIIHLNCKAPVVIYSYNKWHSIISPPLTGINLWKQRETLTKHVFIAGVHAPPFLSCIYPSSCFHD